MHELSIAVSMIERILEEARNRGGLQVEAVHLKLGVFSGVDKDALAFSYEIACEDTPLAGSQLIIESVPLRIFCDICETECAPQSMQQMCCPHCNSPSQKIICGRELEVAALEIAS
jgi:hydrogenase nickel incorporation protein HypA/HybF